MRLRAQRDMHVTFPTLDLRVSFEAGEEMRTEISSKFTSQRLADDLSAAGLAPRAQFTDPDGLYRLTLAARS
jgi:L-histidine N-alpha-methyltransferase